MREREDLNAVELGLTHHPYASFTIYQCISLLLLLSTYLVPEDRNTNKTQHLTLGKTPSKELTSDRYTAK